MKAYVEIVDGKYPTFTLVKKNPAAVEIPARAVDFARWKAVSTAYIRTQKEIEDLVNHYQPLALRKELK